MANHQLIDYARFIGTLGTGLSAGLLLSLPVFSFNSLDAVTGLTKAQRLTFWKATYTRGRAIIPAMLGTSSIAFLLGGYSASGSAFVASRSLFLFDQRVCTRSSVFIGIGLLNLGVLGYTFGVMSGLITRMMDTSARPESNMKVDTDDLIRRWLQMHNSRIALVSAAFVVSVVELIAF